MARSGVGRMRRTASRPAYAYRPPSIQAVAERPIGRVVVRLGLRTLAVTGFAAAAWLLSASAAQAAEGPRVPPTSTSVAAPAQLVTPVADALAVAHQPALRTPSALLAGAVAPVAEAVPPAGAAAPIADPLDGVLRPVTGTLRTAAAPVTAVVDAVTRPAAVLVRQAGVRSVDVRRGVVPPVDVRQGGGRSGGPQRPVVVADPPGRAAGAATPVEGGHAVAAVPSPSGTRSRIGSAPGAKLRPVGVPVGRDGTGDNPGGPGGPLPAPLRGHPGFGAGIPTNGTGSPLEGGLAVQSASVAAGPVEPHRRPAPATVVVTRQDAESPTVSPD